MATRITPVYVISSNNFYDARQELMDLPAYSIIVITTLIGTVDNIILEGGRINIKWPTKWIMGIKCADHSPTIRYIGQMIYSIDDDKFFSIDTLLINNTSFYCTRS
jgi:hypothetical protein